MRLFAIVFALTLAAAGQEVRMQGWQTGCVSITGFALFKDACTPDNQPALGTFSVPAIGEHFYDSNFGSRQMSISGPNFMATQAYSAVSAFSRSGKYAYRCTSGSGDIINPKTGAVVVPNPPLQSCGYQLWSSLDDNIIYYYSDSTNWIKRYDVRTQTSTTVMQFDGTAGKPNFTSISIGGTGDLSSDDWVAVFSAGSSQICVIDLKQATPPYACLSFAADIQVGFHFTDFVMISKGVDSVTGKRYAMWLPDIGSSVLYSFTSTSDFTRVGLLESPDGTGNHDGIWTTGETGMKSAHSDTGQTSDGRQFYMRNCDIGSARQECFMFFNFGTKMTGSQANGGGLRLGRYVAVGLPFPAVHVGCARQAPVCVTSYQTLWYNGTSWTARPLADVTATQTHASARLIVMNGDAGAWYKPIATTRMELWNEAYYWQSPRACLSQDGAYVWYGTNYGQQLSVGSNSFARSAIIDVGYDPKNLRVTGRSATDGTLRYSAPDSAACTRIVSTNADFSSPFVSESDGGGVAERSRALTGLTASTRYYVRVTCGTQNADMRFAASNNLQ
jgi:hypothetical protein